MPAPSATTIPSPGGHQWHIRFDRVACRDCGASLNFAEDDERPCRGAGKIRPIAGIRQQKQIEGRA